MAKVKKGYHRTKSGRVAKKGLYYNMNKRKRAGTSRKGKGTVSAKALKIFIAVATESGKSSHSGGHLSQSISSPVCSTIRKYWSLVMPISSCFRIRVSFSFIIFFDSCTKVI